MKQTLSLMLLLVLGVVGLAHAAEDRNLSVKASGGKRIALVIGNGKYQHADILPKLDNPTHDAEDIAKALRGFGFEVIERKDQSLEGMNSAIAEFGRKMADAEAALFYFAGHGLQVKGQNYLVPVDANVESEARVQYVSVNVNQVLDEMDGAKSRVNIVMLDACRNNPISGKFRSGATRGLAPVSSQPKGTVIVYATDPGNVAADGDGRNGLFTAGLLTAFKGSDLSLRGVLVRASAEVERGSGQRQTPYINGPATLQENFHFGQGTQVASLVPVPVAPNGGGVSLDDIRQQQEARAKWDKWQTGMKTDFDKVASLNAEPDLQITAWDRFLAGYTQKNPFGDEDEQLRSEARSHKQAAESEKQRRIAVRPIAATTNTVTAGKAFKDCADCPEMLVIPAGNFQMGSPSYEAGRQENEGPTHPVAINRSFALGKTHITRGQFAAFVSASGYDVGSKCYSFDGGKWEERQGRNWRDPGFPQQDSHPAVCINWNDAKAYAEWLSRKTGKSYRLPSEAEWEYAARAGTTTARYWGDSPDQACGYANVGDLTLKSQVAGVTWETHNCSDGFAFTAPAASFKPNAFGLHDMIGNAWEWTEDCWNANYNGAPNDGSAWTTGQCSVGRVLRGGSWINSPRNARSANRLRNDSSVRGDGFGFRLARMLP